MDILSPQSRAVQCAFHRVDLIFELCIVTFHDLDSGPSLHIIGHSLPFEAFALKKSFEPRIHLQLPVMITFRIMIETEPNRGAMHIFPNVVQSLINEGGETFILDQR